MRCQARFEQPKIERKQIVSAIDGNLILHKWLAVALDHNAKIKCSERRSCVIHVGCAVDPREGGIDNKCAGCLTAHINAVMRSNLHIKQLAR